MLIRSKLTKLEHTVTPEQWAKIKSRGQAGKYVVVSKSTEQPTAPKDVQGASYEDSLKAAMILYKEEKWEEAKVAFEDVRRIKNTRIVRDKLEEIGKKLAEIAEAEKLTD